jgi:ATP-dependent Clp protease ATP-binding subunit ClpA
LQIVESEHLLKALLEQPNGLARRIISKAGSDATRLLDKTDAFIRRQPRVSGDTAQQVRPWGCLRRVDSTAEKNQQSQLG